MFDEFEDYNETPIISQEEQEQMDKIKHRLAIANWMAIKNNGIDVQTHESDDTLREIILETLQYFEDLEEYEKCIDLKNALDLL